jgi:myo-inositol-1(or 4)-monophosphatase
MEYVKYLDYAAALARQAGELIRSRFEGDFERGYKSCPADLVTEVDRQAEDLITAGLRERFPEHAVVGEENGGKEQMEPGGFTWYVDPLDGTTNFVYGIPFCCVSIGLACGEKMAAGVVYDPFRHECFSAAAGSGTFLNGNPVHVDRSRKTLQEALLVTGYPANKAFGERLLGIDYHRIIDRCANLRALGSAALELAYVACGRLTGFWENTLMPWDVAAGSLLVEEAGGKVSDINGNKLFLGEFLSIVASNGFIHGELLESLRTPGNS